MSFVLFFLAGKEKKNLRLHCDITLSGKIQRSVFGAALAVEQQKAN